MPRGRKHLPWIKLWFEMLGDPKMTRLSSAEKWYWVGILLLAGQSPIRGKLMLTSTEPMSIEDIAAALSLPPKEVPLLESCIAKLEKLRSVAWNNVCLEVIHFKDRQEVYPSDIPEGELTPNKLRINSELTPTEEEGRGEGQKKEFTLSPKGEGVPQKKEKKTDPQVNEILNKMREFLGYTERVRGGEALPAIEENQAMTADRRIDPIPNYGKEGKAIKRMLTRGLTREEILDCWRSKVSRRGGDFVSMVWVNEDIGKKGDVSGADKKPKQKRVRPIKYIRGSGKPGAEDQEDMP